MGTTAVKATRQPGRKDGSGSIRRRPRRSARRRSQRSEDSALSRTGRSLKWKKILVATDFSPSARIALRSAQALAEEVGATIQIVHVLPPLDPRYAALIGSLGDPDVQRIRMKNAEEALSDVLDRVQSPRVAREGFIRIGVPWRQIIEAARELQAELICIGNSGHSRVERLLLGSTAENLVRRSAVPLLITRRRPLRGVKRVLVPVDLEEGSRATLRFALERLPAGAAIEAIFVIPPPVGIDPSMLNFVADQPRVARELGKFLEKAGAGDAKYSVHLFGDPADKILRRADRMRADLILLATHGRRGVERFFLGSVAEKVVRHAERPVLVLPGRGRAPADH
jgi:nucleotide-binding universal stress UspA family protein